MRRTAFLRGVMTSDPTFWRLTGCYRRGQTAQSYQYTRLRQLRRSRFRKRLSQRLAWEIVGQQVENWWYAPAISYAITSYFVCIMSRNARNATNLRWVLCSNWYVTRYTEALASSTWRRVKLPRN